jgi:Tfp pilus assembly protein PilN
MKAVNLLPPERRQAGPKSPLASFARRPLFAAAAAFVVIVAVALGVATHSASSSVSHKRRQLAEVQTEIALSRAPTKVSASTLASASSRRAEIVSLATRRISWDAFLGTVSRVLPEDVSLVGLTASPAGAAATTPAAPASSYSSSSSGVTAPATPFTISGYTYSQSSVARLLDRLALVPWLSGIQLTGASLAPVGNRSVFQFSIGAGLASTGGAS